MNYFKIYENLCLKGREDRLLDYSEKHHIVPRCMNGTDEDDNLTVLTYREHYMAHYLLTKMYPENSGINYAFLCMLRKHNHGRLLSSHMYDTIKRNFAYYKRHYCTLPNPGTTENSRNSARKRMTENNPNKGGASNHTAKPIEVEYNDGRIERYEYGKKFAETTEISYSTVKTLIRTGKSSPKYDIKEIKQV